MRKARHLVGIVLMGMFLISFTLIAWAYPTYLSAFKTTYDIKAGSTLAKAGCTVCHVSKAGGQKFNPYGTDVRKQLTDANTKQLTKEMLQKIEEVDSDNDGVFNIDEIKVDTLPGDPNSAPAKVTRLHINAMTPAPALDKLNAAFDDKVFRAIKNDSSKVADLRMALAENYLALQVKVYDMRITMANADWDDAIFEIAASTPDTKVMRRLVFQPKTGVGDVTLYLDGEKQATPMTIKWQSSHLKDGGYEIDALVPLNVLQIDPTTPTFLFEVATTVLVKTGGKPIFGSLFGSVEGYKDNAHFGTIHHLVVKPVTAP